MACDSVSGKSRPGVQWGQYEQAEVGHCPEEDGGRSGAGRAEQVPSHPQLSLATWPQSQMSRRDWGRSLLEDSPVFLPRQDISETTHPRAHRVCERRRGKTKPQSLLCPSGSPFLSPCLSPLHSPHLSTTGLFLCPQGPLYARQFLPAFLCISSFSVDPFFLGPVNILEPC